VGDASHFPNHQHPHQYTFEPLVEEAFAQVKTNITDEGTNLADVLTLIILVEMAFGD
jgi:hypothetical protein